ncbi:MAG: NAD-dependent epimerase/dehydratase family protein [Chloroflexota bacterium]|nr:NAD-dependent epimerase/dehydratase family protein [Chloroflexota bacterium]
MASEGFDGTQVLVVGGAGFVGSNLVRALSEQGAAPIRIVDNLLSAERTEVLELPAVEFVEASITDDEVLNALDDDFDYAFHLATYHGNQSSMHDPLADHANNTLTSLKLFNRLSGFRNLRRVVYSSAGCTVAEKIYGDARPTTEEDPVSLHLDSPYQISKIVGEMYANYFNARFGLPAVIARFQNVYGPGEILGAGRWRGTPATVWRNVTPTFVYRALKGWPLTLENEGKSSRDFIYVDDIVRGLMLCATKGEVGEVYNLASGVETTIGELADEINQNVDQPASIQLAERRTWDHSGNRLGSTDKSRAALGFTAEVGLAEGIKRTVDWTRSNLAVIDAAVERHSEHVTVP